jgi:hypothetical protein
LQQNNGCKALRRQSFEALSVLVHLTDYYSERPSLDDLKASIRADDEAGTGFQFTFPRETPAGNIAAFVELLAREGFYY